MVFSSYVFWLIFAMVLIISETLLMSFVAVFFGLGALIVGVLTWLGLMSSLPWQLAGFAGFSVALLFIARGRFQEVFKGDVVPASSQDASALIGQRVEVLTPFEQGKGVVFFRGARWTAYSDEPLVPNASAWIVDHTSITLTVSSTNPNQKNK